MRCYLSQHGLALDKAQDAERPLSPQGREDVARVAGFLSLFTRPKPIVIYCSDKLRARQSAEMFAEGWGVDNISQRAELAANADPERIWHHIHSATEDMMVVGHLPHLDRLAGLMLCGTQTRAPVRFANGGVLCLEGYGRDWRVAWQVNPKMFYRADDEG